MAAAMVKEVKAVTVMDSTKKSMFRGINFETGLIFQMVIVKHLM